jgi:3'-phosphoadenosine 5'-phosphosulfate sulfotransferase
MENKNEEAARAIQAAVEGNATEFSKEMSSLVGNATLRQVLGLLVRLSSRLSTGVLPVTLLG